MSAFLNSLWEEGTRDECLFWLGNICGKKNVLPMILTEQADKKTLFNELVRIYNSDQKNESFTDLKDALLKGEKSPNDIRKIIGLDLGHELKQWMACCTDPDNIDYIDYGEWVVTTSPYGKENRIDIIARGLRKMDAILIAKLHKGLILGKIEDAR